MSKIAARRPDPSEWSSSYHTEQIGATQGDDVLGVLSDQLYWLCELASHLPTMVVDVVHPPHRWTIRQVFAHGIDAERVFGYRIQHLAAGDQTPLQSFDENAYVDARFGLGNFSNLVTEWGHTRQSNVLLLRRIEPRCWDHRGTIGDSQMTLRAVAWAMAAHFRHHMEIVEQRSGQTVQRSHPTTKSS